MTRLRGVAVGAGYFSQCHYDAWARIDAADIVALCDADVSRAQPASTRCGIARVYADVAAMLDDVRPPASGSSTSRAARHFAGTRIATTSRCHTMRGTPSVLA